MAVAYAAVWHAPRRVTFEMRFRSCVIPALRNDDACWPGIPGCIRREILPIHILAAKVETTTRMGTVAHLLSAGAERGRRDDYREPDRRCSGA